MDIRMEKVRPKKRLGQHFLTDHNIARKIVNSIVSKSNIKKIPCIEVGPGMGILTQYLIEKEEFDPFLIEIDSESISYLNKTFPGLKGKILHLDFLELDLQKAFNESLVILGNFPYNISSQILFKVLENKNLVIEVVGMVQKEVAERLAAKPGNKTYGILSVLLQAYYRIEYLFTVNETVFYPPPNVKSAVIRLTRNEVNKLDCDEKLFFKVVKTAFNQRRKTLRNSLKGIVSLNINQDPVLSRRPEQLTFSEFVSLTTLIETEINQNNSQVF